MSPSEILSLKAEDEEMMWQAMRVIEAQEMLASFQVSAFPNMKKAAQEKIHRTAHRAAFPAIYEKPVQVTIEQMAALING